MLVKVKKGWELPEFEATDEGVFLQRRQLVKAMGLGTLLVAGGGLSGRVLAATPAGGDDPSASLYPVKRNPKYTLDRDLTKEEFVTSYNNYYEFGSQKDIKDEAQALKIRPWTVRLDGMVEKEMTVDIDTLLKQMPLEERLYRHRCVEAWSMAVPWSGFAFKSLVDFARPLSSAKYVRMETLADKKVMPGLQQVWYPWPYVEGPHACRSNQRGGVSGDIARVMTSGTARNAATNGTENSSVKSKARRCEAMAPS